jgi:hypothetical protein
LRDKRDAQRGRVYAWEDRVIAPRDPTLVAFSGAQAMVDAIWADMGLRYPPGVERLPRQSRAKLASATRLSIMLPAHIPSWCLLHELAHAMTSTIDEGSDGHGPLFMGVYVKLLSRYLRIDRDDLLNSAASDGIEVTPDATPVFLDPGRPAGNRHMHAQGQTPAGRIRRATQVKQL